VLLIPAPHRVTGTPQASADRDSHPGLRGWSVCRPGCTSLVYSVLRWVGTLSVVVVRLCW